MDFVGNECTVSIISAPECSMLLIDHNQSEPCSASCLHVYNLTCTNTILRKYPAEWMIIRMLRGAQIDMNCWSCWSVFKAAYEHTTYVTSLDLVTRSPAAACAPATRQPS